MAKNKKRELEMVKTKTRSSHRKLSHHRELPFLNNGVSTIAMGAVAGCVIGAAAALILTPKPKRHKFTQSLDNIYDHISDTAHEYACGAQDALTCAKESAENLCSAAADMMANGGRSRNLALGVIGAGLLGASAIYLMSQKEFPESFSKRWATGKWSDMAKHVVDVVSDKLHGAEDSLPHGGHNAFQHVFDWALTGFNLWQELKKRR